MTLITCASNVGDFTGWGGVGHPTYFAVAASAVKDVYPLQLTGYQGSLDSHGWGYGCAWLQFAKQAPVVSMSLLFYLSNFVAGNAMSAPIVFHDTTTSMYLVIGPNISVATTSYDYYAYTTPDILDKSKYTLLGKAFTFSRVDFWAYLTVDISGIGTKNGTITVCNDIYDSIHIPAGTQAGLLSADLSSFTGIDAVSFHAPDSVTTSDACSWYIGTVGISTISLRASDMRTFIPTSVNGTYTEWVGTAASFTTVPTLYTNYGTGFYGTRVGSRVTFANRTDVTLPVGYEFRGIVLAANIRGGLESATSTSGYMYNPTTKDSHTVLDAVQTVNTGSTARWVMPVDPITGNKWALTDYNVYEFGVKRSS